MGKQHPVPWPREEHTAAKHDVLGWYLDAWVPIIGRSFKDAVLIDCFAGPGVYEGGEPGSPILMLDRYLNRRDRKTLRATFHYYFIENDPRALALLEPLVEKRRRRLPEDSVCEVVRGEYADRFPEVLDRIKRPDGSYPPTFAFIDPCGHGGLPMTLHGDFLEFRQCEVLIFFSLPEIARFVSRAGQEPSLNALFDGTEWEAARDLQGAERREFLLNLFQRKLEARTEHVRAFQMITREGRDYWLFFGTRNLTGLDRMKDAMWRRDPQTGRTFRDVTNRAVAVLFEEEPDTRPLLADLSERYGLAPFSSADAEAFTRMGIFHHEKHLKTRSLKPAEKLGLIEVVDAPPGRKKGQFPSGTVMRFTRQVLLDQLPDMRSAARPKLKTGGKAATDARAPMEDGQPSLF